ncbi:hypothetical protein [Rhodomicrobium sp.]|uniref:hypothetical protein n=1 Tax=Rhodomicrobium sp. TaxID=2720632 RepID=UPI0039E2F865
MTFAPDLLNSVVPLHRRLGAAALSATDGNAIPQERKALFSLARGADKARRRVEVI